jgi:hypothetical protein
MDLMVIISALIALVAIGLIVALYIQMSRLKRTYTQDIQSIRELFEELETKFNGDNSTWPKPALAIPPRHNNDAYKKPVLPPEKERKQPPPPANPLKTKRW